MNYILVDKKPVVEKDIIKWSRWYEKGDRKVANTVIDGVRVSTVFLGLDHSFESGEPILFETLVFDGDKDGDMDRCSTWEQAEKMHEKMCTKVRG